MENPFLHNDPFITPSINRVRVVDLPGIVLPEAVRGRLGYEFLSAAALAGRIRRQAGVLGLNPDRPDLIRAFDGCLTATSAALSTGVFPQNLRVASSICQEHGRFLGYLLLTLKRGDPANRAARPDWDGRHWAWWAQIETVWLGGGMVSGHLGPIMAEAAQTVVRDGGFPDFAVYVSPYGRNISLAGAARMAQNEKNLRHPRSSTSQSLVFDFGHTSVKRAVAQFADGRLQTLIPLPSLPAPCEPYDYHGWSLGASEETLRGMVTAVAQTWQDAHQQGRTLGPIIVISLACYLQNGHPIPAHLETGCYARLQTLTGHLESFVREQIRSALAQPVQVKLVHDATAAAMAYEGWRKTAVITLGTSLGIGFPSYLANGSR